MDNIKYFSVIKGPLLTSKASILNKEKNNISKLVISVDIKANKKSIKKAMESLFGVEVLSVNTINVLGKTKLSQRKYSYKKSDFKKAIVTVKADSQKFEGLNSSFDDSQSSLNNEDSSNNFISQDNKVK